MPTTITDNAGSIKITTNVQVRIILKSQVAEVSVVKTDLIKIDMGKGALDNVLIRFTDVISPVTASPADLRDAILAFLPNAGASPEATEAKQIEQISTLNDMKTFLQNIQSNAFDGYHGQGMGNTIGQMYDYLFFRLAPLNYSTTFRQFPDWDGFLNWKGANPYVRLIQFCVDGGKVFSVSQE
jgi:hypothetical protein